MSESVAKWAYLPFVVRQSVEEWLFDWTVFDLAQFDEALDFCLPVYSFDENVKCGQILLTHDKRHHVSEAPFDVVVPSEEVPHVQVQVAVFAREDSRAFRFKEGVVCHSDRRAIGVLIALLCRALAA